MGAHQKQLQDRHLRMKVFMAYKDTDLTMEQIAARLGISLHTVREILPCFFSLQELKEQKRRRYANSKLAERNPASGQVPSNWIGECEDGYGYLTRVLDGTRYFVHRIAVAEDIGIHPSELPRHWVVHHIDEDKQNNDIDNLALVTNAGHRQIHLRYNFRTNRKSSISTRRPPLKLSNRNVYKAKRRRPPNC